MKSLLLISIIIAAVAVPVIAARDPRPGRGLARMLVVLVAFNLVYLAYLTLIHVTVFVPHWP
jgi:hypothetical protein